MNQFNMSKIIAYTAVLSIVGLTTVVGCGEDDDEGQNGGPGGVTTDCDPDASPFGGGAGNTEDPHLLCSPHHLNNVATEANHSSTNLLLLITEDIDMSAITDFDIIGDDSPNRFSGTFDGGGHTISNLAINLEDGNPVGMFGRASASAVIENVTINNIDITGDRFVGGLVGNNLGTIVNSHVSGQVYGDRRTGGLVGHNSGEIVDSSSSADVSTESLAVGGLVGMNTDDAEISGSYATGNVHNQSGNAGGLVGDNFGTITDSYSSSTVDTDGTNAGGLVGEASGGTITDSHATGNVSGDMNVGGLVGNNRADIVNTYFDGAVTEGALAGGLVGLNSSNGTISTSYSHGSIDGRSITGGLVSHNQGTITDSYTTVTVYNESDFGRAGGFVGHNEGDITNSYSSGEVDGPDHQNFGGFIGLNDNAAGVTSSYWDTTTSGWNTSEGGTGIETGEFGTSEDFEEWDFSNTWTIGTAPDEADRPILQWQ